MSTDYLPKKDADLLTFAEHAPEFITANAAALRVLKATEEPK